MEFFNQLSGGKNAHVARYKIQVYKFPMETFESS